jgi:hypothetical protein
MNTKFGLENLEGRDCMGKLGVDRMTLKRILKDVDWIHLAQEDDNEHSDSTKCRR